MRVQPTRQRKIVAARQRRLVRGTNFAMRIAAFFFGRTIIGRMIRLCKPLAVLAAVFTTVCWLGACAPSAMSPIRFDSAGLVPKADYANLSAVLKKCVTGKGLLDRRELAGCSERLDVQLALLTVTGPSASPALFPTREDALAYWYNARAAWAIKLAACDPNEPPPASRLEDQPFILDGRTMTLRAIDATLAARGDWRLPVAAPGIRFCRAALPDKPFSPVDILQQIPGRINDLLADPRRTAIDVDRQEVLIPPIIWRFRNQISEEHRRTYGQQGATVLSALLPYAHGRALHRLQDAVGYRAVEAPSQGKLAIK